MSNGHRIIVGFLLLMYLVPAVGQFLFGDQIITSYRLYPVTGMAIIGIAGTYALFLLLRTISISIFPPLTTQTLRSLLVALGRLYLRFRLGFGVLGITVGSLLTGLGLNTYMYGDENISGRVDWVIALIGLSASWRVAAYCDVFYRIFVAPRWVGTSSRRWFCENVMISVGLILVSTGIAALWVAFLALWHALAPKFMGRVILRKRNQKMSLKGAGRFSFAIVSFLAIFIVAYYLGSVIKFRSSILGADVELLSEEPLKIMGLAATDAYGSNSLVIQSMYYLLERSSIYFYSWTFTSATGWNQLNRDGWVLSIPLQTFLFRLDMLLGRPVGVGRPETGSIARLNYELLTAGEIRPREGSSPGLLGDFNYAFPFPLNILLCALFLRWWSRQLDTLFSQHQKQLTGFGMLVAFVILHGLFQSPSGWLLILDEGVFMPLLLGATAIAHRKPTRAHGIDVSECLQI